MYKEFKEFAMKPGLIEIGVGLVMAAALGALITSLVENILMPIVAAVFGQPDFSSLFAVGLGDSTILFGVFLTAVITFISIAFAVFFFVIKPFQAYQERTAKPVEEEVEEDPEDLVLLREIRDALNR